MTRRIKLEIGVGFEEHWIRQWAMVKGYIFDRHPNGSSITIYNKKGQYTEFQWYDYKYYCTALWYKITNQNNPYYIFGTNDDVEIYE